MRVDHRWTEVEPSTRLDSTGRQSGPSVQTRPLLESFLMIANSLVETQPTLAVQYPPRGHLFPAFPVVFPLMRRSPPFRPGGLGLVIYARALFESSSAASRWAVVA